MAEVSTDELLSSARKAYEDARYAEAESLQEKAVTRLRSTGAADLVRADAVETLGAIHYVQEKFNRSESEYDEAIRIREAALPPGDSATLRSLLGLSKSLFKQQKYEPAEKVMRRLLAEAEQAKMPDEQLASIHHELGFQLYFVGRYLEADSYLTRALELYEGSVGPSHIGCIDVLERLALNAEHCPELGKDPEPFYRAAVDRIPAGQMQRRYAENICRLAGYLRDKERFTEADQQFELLLKIIESLPDMQELHWVESDCAKYFSLRGKPELAERIAARAKKHDPVRAMFDRQLAHAEQTLSEDDPALFDALLAKGNHALFNDNTTEAENLFRRALAAATRIHGGESESAITSMNRLSVALRVLGRIDEGSVLADKAMTIATSRCVGTDLEAWTIENAATIREAQGRIAEASALYERAMELYVSLFGFPSRESVEAKYRLSGHYLRINNMRAAKLATSSVIAAMDAVPELTGYEKYDYLHNHAAVLESEGKQAEAKKLRDRAEKLLEQAKAELEND